MKIGITGHQKIANPDNWPWVAKELKNTLNKFNPPIIGLSCLALGADQLFARTVLDTGGQFIAILPFPGYENVFHGEAQYEYLSLLSKATSTICLERSDETDEEAYLLAGKVILEQSDVLVAIWDGMPAEGLGGTGDVVSAAIQSKIKVIQINPDTRTVSSF
jgi:hypothetical protein